MVLDLLDKVVEHAGLNRYPHEFSGGQRAADLHCPLAGGSPGIDHLR